MNRTVRAALTVLVLLNLVFVQLTDAVGLQWLVPLQVLTALSPMFVGLQERAWWRNCWNLGVLTIFALLVRDTATSGPRHLLEDGLILAAFCQVHLLNALRAQQKPDLLFFNSFLIALVTSFFCQDLAFSITFVVYALVFVGGLELAADDGRRPAAHVLCGASARAAVLVGVTALLFAFVPRDFRREGLVDERALGSLVGASTSGFDDRVDLGRSSPASVSDRIVLRIRTTEGDPASVSGLWRGAALEYYDSGGWRTRTRPRNQDPLSLRWDVAGRGHWTRTGSTLARAVVECDDAQSAALFVPLEAIEVGVPADAHPDTVYPRADGTFARRAALGTGTGRWSYGVGVAAGMHPLGTATPRSMAPFLQIDPADPVTVPPAAHQLLRDALRGLPPGAAQAEIVEACRALLEGRFEYVLPGHQGAARDLAAFMAGDGGGHCELFATALAVLLRLHGIPCRVATGYLVEEWDATASCFVVRQRHAHAWVEVYDRERRLWTAADATPPTSRQEATSGDWADALTAPLRDVWRAVTAFDGEARDRLVGGLMRLPGRAWALAGCHPWSSAGIVLALVALLHLVRGTWRRRLRDPVVTYERALRRLRLRREPNETPRELVARARTDARLDTDALSALDSATAAHEAARFASARFSGGPGSWMLGHPEGT